MQKHTENETNHDMDNIRDHMANERTFLAWIRTSIGIMAFGFVLEKSSLFLKQIQNLFLNPSVVPKLNLSVHLSSHSAFLGIALVEIGGLMSLLAFFKYIKNRKLIREKQFKNTVTLDFVLTLIVFLVGLLLTVYLINNRLIS